MHSSNLSNPSIHSIPDWSIHASNLVICPNIDLNIDHNAGAPAWRHHNDRSSKGGHLNISIFKRFGTFLCHCWVYIVNMMGWKIQHCKNTSSDSYLGRLHHHILSSLSKRTLWHLWDLQYASGRIDCPRNIFHHSNKNWDVGSIYRLLVWYFRCWVEFC